MEVTENLPATLTFCQFVKLHCSLCELEMMRVAQKKNMHKSASLTHLEIIQMIDGHTQTHIFPLIGLVKCRKMHSKMIAVYALTQ